MVYAFDVSMHYRIDPLIVYKPHSVAVQTTITFAQDSGVRYFTLVIVYMNR